MADLTITPASVLAGDNATLENGKSGATITAGRVVYFDLDTKKSGLADSNGSGAAKVPRGISLNAASDNQPLSWQRSGDIVIGAALVAGTAYYLSDTPGCICPLADVGSGEDVVFLGIARSSTVLALDIQIPGVTL